MAESSPFFESWKAIEPPKLDARRNRVNAEFETSGLARVSEDLFYWRMAQIIPNVIRIERQERDKSAVDKETEGEKRYVTQQGEGGARHVSEWAEGFVRDVTEGDARDLVEASAPKSEMSVDNNESTLAQSGGLRLPSIDELLLA